MNKKSTFLNLKNQEGIGDGPQDLNSCFVAILLSSYIDQGYHFYFIFNNN